MRQSRVLPLYVIWCSASSVSATILREQNEVLPSYDRTKSCLLTQEEGQRMRSTRQNRK